MATLRELEICKTEGGEYYFIISEHGTRIFTSDRYRDSGECAEIGVHMMDEFHERSPLRSVDNPHQFIHFPRKSHDQNE